MDQDGVSKGQKLFDYIKGILIAILIGAVSGAIGVFFVLWANYGGRYNEFLAVLSFASPTILYVLLLLIWYGHIDTSRIRHSLFVTSMLIELAFVLAALEGGLGAVVAIIFAGIGTYFLKNIEKSKN